MLSDGVFEIHDEVRSDRDWREVDRELRGIAKRRAALDADEARWLREARRPMIWREVGCGSLGDDPARAQHQIAIRRCDACGSATQEAAGQLVAIDAAAADRAACDADRLEADGAVTHEIPAKIRRLVWRRDLGKCRVPGCRATRNLEVHHIIARADGGDHDPDNLILLCNGHHDDHHRGTLSIAGTASALKVERHVESRMGLVAMQLDARAALVTMGFRPGEAKAAIERATSHTGSHVNF